MRIKNPLTPIALSAERIIRHLERNSVPDAASVNVMHDCAETISGAVETVRTLVNEFAALASFPTAQPEPSDINSLIESSLAMFNGRLDGIRVHTKLAHDLPRVMADSEAIRRAFANLVDNAAEAMQDAALREINISTSLVTSRDAVEIIVADTGPGVTQDLKEKLFLPYFSTKKRGTGLGLAIVSRIIEEHHGSIRVEENGPWERASWSSTCRSRSRLARRSLSMPNILIVDDEPGIRESLKGILEEEGFSATLAESGESCLDVLRKHSFDAVLLDVWLPKMDGLETLTHIREMENAPEVTMISGHGTMETAVRATKLGAYDFLEKPLSIDKTLILLKHAVEAKRLRTENRELKKQLTPKSSIVGESIPMKALRQQIQLMAPTNGRVLIFGESGTGKELAAHAIHAQSQRKDEMFVEVNCAAIPEDLIESELFGHTKGAFSGAASDKEGKFQRANGGTLFLDEVGDMSLKTIPKCCAHWMNNVSLRLAAEKPLRWMLG